MPKIDRSSLLFAANCTAAALLALFIGFSIDLARPYWALITVYIVSHPLTGAVRSKAAYRVVGTLLGAACAVLVVPPLVDEPLLLSLAFALWAGGCLVVSLLDRTPRGYAMMLAGYTATIIGFPAVNHPERIFDVAVARVEEIILGIVCATVMHSLVFPRSVTVPLKERLAAALDDARQWGRDVLGPGAPTLVGADRRHLASDISEIYQLSLLLPWDAAVFPAAVMAARAMHQRLLMLIPVLSALEDRIAALRNRPGGIDAEAASAIGAVAGWLAEGGDHRAGHLLERALGNRMADNLNGDWAGLLRHSLLTRLQDLVSNLSEARFHLAALSNPQPLPVAGAAEPARRPLHKDVGMAVLSGLSSTLTILLVCGGWIWSGWPDGAAAAGLAGIFCALFAGNDDPGRGIVTFGLCLGLSFPVAAFYEFVILPGIDGFALLALFLSPLLLATGLLLADRRTAVPCLAFMIGFGGALALQENYTADFADFLNSNGALFVAMMVALAVTRALRSISVDTAARRLLRGTWKGVAVLAYRPAPPHPAEIFTEMVDRIGLLIPKLAGRAVDSDIQGIDVLLDLRIGMNIAMIQRYRATRAAGEAQDLTTLLHEVGGYFSGLRAGVGMAPPEQALRLLDGCLRRAVASSADRTAKYPGIAALVGLRRNLFPDAPPFIIGEREAQT